MSFNCNTHNVAFYISSVVKTNALDFKQLYPIKRMHLAERIPYLTLIFNCSIQK